jgi:hypothetical protein
MKRIILATALGAVTTIALLPGVASASGPAAPGKKLLQLECAGLGAVTVSVPPGEGSNGAGQIVGQKGHGIVVSSTSFVGDFTTFTLLSHETRETGGGHAHSNQATIHCESSFEGTASEFFGNEGLPSGVGPGDLIIAGIEAQVILKP